MPDYLSVAEKHEFERVLHERYEQLRDEVQKSLNESDDLQLQALAGRVHDPGEESVADLIMDLNLQQLEQYTEEIRATEAALGRLSNGTYGICTECGAEIGVERLRAVPTATRCVRCQALLEQQSADGGETPTL